MLSLVFDNFPKKSLPPFLRCVSCGKPESWRTEAASIGFAVYFGSYENWNDKYFVLRISKIFDAMNFCMLLEKMGLN